MNAKEYLGRLEAALGAMPGPEREDFLREMESHIEDLRARKPEDSEESIVSGLTPPELLAAELQGERANDEERPRGDDRGPSGEGARAGGRSARFAGADRGWSGFGGGPGSRLKSALEALSRLDELSDEFGKLGDLSRHFQFRCRADGEEPRTVSIRMGSTGAATIRMSLVAADLEIGPSDSDFIAIEAQGERPDEALEREICDDAVVLRERAESGMCLSRIKVEVPPTIRRIEVKGVSGDVRARGVEAEVKLVSSSGDIELADLGLVSVQTASGDVSVRGAGSVELATASGDVEIAKVRGDVAVKTASGDIDVRSVEGAVRVDSAGGDIEVKALRSTVEAKSISGEIGIEDCPGGVAASSKSGSVDADLRSGFGGLSATAFTGDIAVRLPAEPRATVVAESRSGEVAVGASRGSRVGTDVGGGGPRLELKSLSGDISVTW